METTALYEVYNIVHKGELAPMNRSRYTNPRKVHSEMDIEERWVEAIKMEETGEVAINMVWKKTKGCGQ